MSPDEVSAAAIDGRWLQQVIACDSLLHDCASLSDCGSADLAASNTESLARSRLLFLLRMLDAAEPPAESPQEPGDSSGGQGRQSRLLLSRFEVLDDLGSGGFGFVVHARDRLLGRDVALKMPLPERLLSREDVDRFLREARAAARLDHPHIVRVYDAGELGPLGYFIASEFCPGPSLRQWLKAQTDAVPVRLAARWIAALADAVQHAHDRGILHRDIKPDNVIIAVGPGPDDFIPRLTDFGLAKLDSDSGDETRTEALLGTPHYMAPEQAAGRRREVGPATDVYALGATLYEVLTGRPPLRGETDAETLRLILEADPLAPRSLRPGLPRDLETILRKCLHKEPARRYGSAGALCSDLQRFLEGRPILARPPGAFQHAAKWARRHRPVVAAAASVILVMVLGLGVAVFWRNGVLRHHTNELRKALEVAEENKSSTRRLWYASQVRHAQQAWSSGQVELAQELLERVRPQTADPDLRGFEWHYLRQMFHRDVSVLLDHDSRSMILTPDGRTLISGDRYGSIIFWDLAAGRELMHFQGHSRDVSGLLLSPDDRILVSWSTKSGEPSEVKLWDARSARHLATVPEMQGYAESVAFAPDAAALVILERAVSPNSGVNRLVFWNLARGPERLKACRSPITTDVMACSRDGRWIATGMFSGSTVTLRDAGTGEPVSTLCTRFPGVGGIAFSPDGKTLVAHSPGLTIWNLPSGRVLASLPEISWSELAFSPDGRQIAGITAAGDRIELVTDLTTRPRLVPLEAATARELHMAFSPDGKLLAGGGLGRSATLWETTSGRKLAECPSSSGVLAQLTFAHGNESLIFAGADARIRAWHFAKKPLPVAQFAGHDAEVWGLTYTADGTSLISAADDHSIKIWDASHGDLRLALAGHTKLVSSLASTSDGKLLASGSFDETVRLWDVASGQSRGVLRGHTDRVRAVAFSPNGRLLASAGSDRTVRIWDVDRGETIFVFKEHTDTVRALAFDASGTVLISSSDDRTIRGIDVKRQREAFSLPCANHNSALALSPDGSSLASADDRGNLSIWDVATWTRRLSVKGSDTQIWGLGFSPDGRALAAACGDAKVRLWDPITGQLMLVLDGHAKRVNAVAFAPDGATLASASHDGAVRLWHAARP